MLVYTPATGDEASWGQEASLENMQRAMGNCEPRLVPDGPVMMTVDHFFRVRQLGRLARPPVCVPKIDHPGLENWVEDSGRMVVIGEAAHPLPVRNDFYSPSGPFD